LGATTATTARRLSALRTRAPLVLLLAPAARAERGVCGCVRVGVSPPTSISPVMRGLLVAAAIDGTASVIRPLLGTLLAAPEPGRDVDADGGKSCGGSVCMAIWRVLSGRAVDGRMDVPHPGQISRCSGSVAADRPPPNAALLCVRSNPPPLPSSPPAAAAAKLGPACREPRRASGVSKTPLLMLLPLPPKRMFVLVKISMYYWTTAEFSKIGVGCIDRGESGARAGSGDGSLCFLPAGERCPALRRDVVPALLPLPVAGADAAAAASPSSPSSLDAVLRRHVRSETFAGGLRFLWPALNPGGSVGADFCRRQPRWLVDAEAVG
jgi:hypothetical protein